jgi:hypothetical protein
MTDRRIGHLPARPTWDCLACGRLWPCLTAREDLWDEYAQVPTALCMYLAACFMECCADQPGVSAERLYLRFLGWVQLRRPARPPDPDRLPARPH